MEKPIIFNTEMVRAILEGKKTQTRRTVKPQPKQPVKLGFISDSTDKKRVGCYGWGADECGGVVDVARPPYQVGDVLWVRETWAPALDTFAYKANYSKETLNDPINKGLWKPSIHMPKDAARIFLEVTNVRVERLQDITEEEARKEGCFLPSYKNGELVGSSVILFEIVWKSIYKNWDENPWVWVIEFKRIDKGL